MFSIILLIKGNSDIVLKLVNISLSRLCFFRSGITTACFKISGIFQF